MAGVNLNEENARILATNSELVGTQIRSCKDETFLQPGLLHRRILEIGKTHWHLSKFTSSHLLSIASCSGCTVLQCLASSLSRTTQTNNDEIRICCLLSKEHVVFLVCVVSSLKTVLILSYVVSG